jgi:cytochrome P450 family 26 subfamily A
MIFGVTAKKLISHDDVASGGSLWKCFDAWTKGLMSFPICVPGTAFYKCMQVHMYYVAISNVTFFLTQISNVT